MKVLNECAIDQDGEPTIEEISQVAWFPLCDGDGACGTGIDTTQVWVEAINWYKKRVAGGSIMKSEIPQHSQAAAETAQYHAEGLDEKRINNKVLFEEISNRLNLLQSICHGNAVNAGWYTDLQTGEWKNLNVGERIALMHSELSEAFEAHRKDLMDDHLPHRKGLEVELADAVIRIFDFAGAENLDLAGAIIEKLQYNRTRADHKLENRVKEGGKKC